MSSSIFCTALYAFILQSAFSQLCNWGWLPYENRCYRYSEGNIEHGQAQEYCMLRNAQLVEYLPDELKDRFLKFGDKSETFDYWCHTKQDNTNAFTLSRRKRNSVKSCCVVNNTRLEDGNCGNITRYICVKESTRNPDGCDEKDTEPDVLAWDDARKHCQCMGADLYSLNEWKDMNKFFWFAQDMYESIWIGLRKDRGSDVFRWSDGSPVSEYVLQTVDPKAEEDQLCYAYDAGNRLWEATNCFDELQFICKEQDLTTSTTQELTTANLITSSTEDLTTTDLTTSTIWGLTTSTTQNLTTSTTEELTTSTTQDLTTSTTQDLTTSTTQELTTSTTQDLATSTTQDLTTSTTQDLTTSTTQDLTTSTTQDLTTSTTQDLTTEDLTTSSIEDLTTTGLTTSKIQDLTSTNLTTSTSQDLVSRIQDFTSRTTVFLSLLDLNASTTSNLISTDLPSSPTKDTTTKNCNDYIWVIGIAILAAVCVLLVVNIYMIRWAARRRGSLDIKGA